MPPLIDPERLAAYRDALANWSVRGYIHFELSEEAKRWARSALNVPFRDIGRKMHEHVLGGGEIDEVRVGNASMSWEPGTPLLGNCLRSPTPPW